MRLFILLIGSLLLVTPLYAAKPKPKPLNPEEVREQVDRLLVNDQPARQIQRWDKVRKGLAYNQKKFSRRLSQQKVRIDRAKEQKSVLQKSLMKLDRQLQATTKTPHLDTARVAALEKQYRQTEADLLKRIEGIRVKADQLKKYKTTRQGRQVTYLLNFHQRQLQNVKMRQDLLAADPTVAQRLEMEEKLHALLKQISASERQIFRFTKDSRKLVRQTRELSLQEEDLWSSRLSQVNALLPESEAPPFLQTLRYSLKDGTACYETSWVSRKGEADLAPWEKLVDRRDRLVKYRSLVLQEQKIAERDYRQALAQYKKLQKDALDRRWFELATRVGLETYASTFVETPGLGTDLVRGWLLSPAAPTGLSLEMLPGSLLRLRQGAGVGLFGLAQTGAPELPVGDPLLRSWQPFDVEALVRVLQPWIQNQASWELATVQTNGKLGVPVSLRHSWKALRQRVQGKARARINPAQLAGRAPVAGTDQVMLREMAQRKADVFLRVAEAEMELALAALRRELVSAKRSGIHQLLLSLVQQEAPAILESLSGDWEKARVQKTSLPWQAHCSNADTGVLTLGFSRSVKLEEARINKVPLILTRGDNRTRQFRLFLPPQWDAGVPNKVSVKARLKKRLLPTHQLDTDPTSRSLPLLKPDGSLAWKNYQAQETFSGQF